MCQTGEPVKPFTCVTPKAAAARAVSFIRSAARSWTPAGSPSPQTSGGRIALVARVDRVADRLPDEVRAERPAAEVVALERLRLSA